MAYKVVWQAIFQGRNCVIRRCSYFDTQKEIDEYNRQMAEAGLSKMSQCVWYCGYMEVKPEDGEIYKLVTQTDDDFELDLIFPHAYRGITWCGEMEWGGMYIGFDTNHFLMEHEKPHTLAQTINDVGGMVQDLEKWREFHEKS